ncbi:hypothetical protein ABBQ32_004737 [Trebouxia sp. C0010 RCD-2024]
MTQEVLVAHPSTTKLNLRGYLRDDVGARVNICQKPLLQLEFLLRVCHQGGWVVDLCCASGSGLVAAVRLGHSAAGFDLSEKQVDASKRRLQQLSLKEMRAHSAHKKAAKLAALKGDSPHEAQAAQEASVPDSPAGSQDVDGDEDDQDPEYREGDEGQERDEGSEAEYDEEGRSDMEAQFDDAGDND